MKRYKNYENCVRISQGPNRFIMCVVSNLPTCLTGYVKMSPLIAGISLNRPVLGVRTDNGSFKKAKLSTTETLKVSPGRRC